MTMIMISIARKNLPSLLLKNPNSNVHLSLSINCFSTSRNSKLISSPEIYDVLFQKHHFSPEFASSIASAHLTKSTTPERANSVLSFMKENSFKNAQLEKILRYDPRILGVTVEGLEFRLKLFRDLGLSSEEVAKMMSSNQSVLHSSIENNIIPKLSILKVLLGSDQDVATLLRKSAWFLPSDLDKTLIPNVEILMSSGIPMERVRHFLFIYPRWFLYKHDVIRKSVDKAIEFGVPLTSVVFIHAVGVIALTSPGMWELKLKILRDFGFSDDEIFSMFRKQPMVFGLTGKKIESVLKLLIGTWKYSISDIVSTPSSMGYSIEKRLEPRLQVLALLESRSLIEKRPGLRVLCGDTDDKFFDKYVNPYFDEIGEESITKRLCRGQRNSS